MPVIINGTTGVTFPNGVTMSDGTSAPVTVAQGGTGATTAANARTSLGTNDAANITTGAVAIANGGTGSTTAAAAFNALNPMTTTGDILYEASPTVAARLAIGSTGQILTVSGGIPAWSAPPVAGDNGRGQAFTSSGTFTIPAGTTAVKVTVVGGGGGGGGNPTDDSNNYGAGGGGGGGTAFVFLTNLTPNNTISVTVGGGGSGTTGNGNTGGTSSISSGTQSITTVTATGGQGGVRDTGNFGFGGNGGTTTNATYGSGGGPGWSGARNSQGGASLFGQGGPTQVNNQTGQNGTGYGGGGSGVCWASSGPTARNGGSGTAGVVIFEW